LVAAPREAVERTEGRNGNLTRSREVKEKAKKRRSISLLIQKIPDSLPFPSRLRAFA
jgi:hypothetical protein